VKVPAVVVRTCPSVVVPDTDGTTVFTGVMDAIAAVAELVPEALPTEFVAVTTERIV
jgi:hypothetical protein